MWSKEEEYDVYKVMRQDGIAGQVVALKAEGGEAGEERFDFKKRNAWEIHKNQMQREERRPQGAIMESDRLPAVKELRDTARVALINFRVRTDGVQGNQVHSITVRGLGIPQTDFQLIPSHHKFYSIIVRNQGF